MPVRSCYIDVDFTLIGKDGKLYPKVKEALAYMSDVLDYTMMCWSHSGKEHAKAVCERQDIVMYFDLFLDKPDIIIDDDAKFILKYPKIIKATSTWGSTFIESLFNKKGGKQ